MNEEELQQLSDAVDEACRPALEDAVAPHLPAIRAALRDLDTPSQLSPEEIVERTRANGLEDPEQPS